MVADTGGVEMKVICSRGCGRTTVVLCGPNMKRVIEKAMCTDCKRIESGMKGRAHSAKKWELLKSDFQVTQLHRLT